VNTSASERIITYALKEHANPYELLRMIGKSHLSLSSAGYTEDCMGVSLIAQMIDDARLRVLPNSFSLLMAKRPDKQFCVVASCDHHQDLNNRPLATIATKWCAPFRRVDIGTTRNNHVELSASWACTAQHCHRASSPRTTWLHLACNSPL